MNPIISFFRDTISGFAYFVYILVILYFIFAIIGYLVTENHTSSK